MNPIGEIREKIEKVTRESFLIALAREVIEENKEFIEDLNIEQLEAGKNIDDSDITPPYTPFTKVLKKAKNQPFDRVTLKDEGDLHRSITTKVFETAFENIATDPKEPKITAKYGDKWLGLSEESKQILLSRLLIPELIIKLRRAILVA